MVNPKAQTLDASKPESVKKKLIVKPVSRQFSLVKVVYEGGGEAPAALQGSWTSAVMAQKAIDVYEKANKV